MKKTLDADLKVKLKCWYKMFFIIDFIFKIIKYNSKKKWLDTHVFLSNINRISCFVDGILFKYFSYKENTLQQKTKSVSVIRSVICWNITMWHSDKKCMMSVPTLLYVFLSSF